MTARLMSQTQAFDVGKSQPAEQENLNGRSTARKAVKQAMQQ